MQINRLFEMVYILLDKKTITAKELAEHFEVSVRTIYRDIDTLSLSGIPVYTTKGKGGGIHLLPNFVLNKSILSDQEQNEILTSLQGLSIVKTEENSLLLDKLSSIFQKDQINWIDVDFSSWHFQEDNYFQLLKSGILERRIVSFDYYNSYGEKSHRFVEPIQIWFKNQAWYFRGYCLTKKDFRLFKITRIRNMMITEETFLPRDIIMEPDKEQVNKDTTTDVTLTLLIDSAMTYRVYDQFDDEQIQKNEDGSFTVTVTWAEDEWVYGVLLSFGYYLKVIEPEHVRNTLKEKLQKSLDQYL